MHAIIMYTVSKGPPPSMIVITLGIIIHRIVGNFCEIFNLAIQKTRQFNLIHECLWSDRQVLITMESQFNIRQSYPLYSICEGVWSTTNP
jgi:hypothetical protein